MQPADGGMEGQKEGRHGPGRGQAPLLVLVVVASLLVLVGFFIHGDSSSAWSGVSVPETTASVTTTSRASASTTSLVESTTTVTASLIHPVRDPVRIVMPSIGVDAPVVPVGLLEDGDMETPHYGYVGWYSLGPAPGEQGPAVMLAHVDSLRKPDVFYGLKELKPGDEILVYGAVGEPAVFQVDSVEEELKIDLPRARIWHYTATALIRLITCGGDWDSRSRHYLSNVIVYGYLVR